MMIEQTLAIIKPDAMAAGYADAIIKQILNNGFNIIQKEEINLSKEEAEGFYAEHKGRSFFDELVEFMISGPVTVMVLEKDNAILAWRDLMGATDPAQAAEGTIRKLFGASKGNNASHGSDSATSAAREIDYFFPKTCCSH
ncbi:nucleoside-diphosphate kinase [Candidatus Babeliales bacterium]|nr:nucleoside-diphosphate kinase [Candidatus Babeliales bacterium]